MVPQRFLTLTLALMLLGSLPALAASNPGSVVDRFFTSYRAGDVEGMLTVYADDALFEDIAQRHRYQGTEELRTFLTQTAGVHKEMDLRENRRVVKGNVVAVDYVYTGTLSGAALSQLTGKEGCQDTDYEIPVTSWYVVRDGRIARQTDFIDLATLNEVRAQVAGDAATN